MEEIERNIMAVKSKYSDISTVDDVKEYLRSNPPSSKEYRLRKVHHEDGILVQGTHVEVLELAPDDWNLYSATMQFSIYVDGFRKGRSNTTNQDDRRYNFHCYIVRTYDNSQEVVMPGEQMHSRELQAEVEEQILKMEAVLSL